MNLAAWVPLFVVFAAFSGWCLWHLALHDVRYMPKWAWALLIVFSMPLGGLVYVLVSVLEAGEQRADAEGRQPPA